MTWRLAMSVLLGATPVSADACSVSNPPKATAAKRTAGRTDLRRVVGILRFDKVEQPTGEAHAARVSAYIQTDRGKRLDVTYSWSQTWVDCMIYFLPQAEASGTFYVSTRRRAGAHELIDWTGAYTVGGRMIGPVEQGSR